MEVKLRSKMSHWPKIPHRYAGNQNLTYQNQILKWELEWKMGMKIKIMELSYLWGEGALAKGQGHGPAPVDHKVKPAVLLGHGVSLGVDVSVGYPHAH